MRSSRFPPLLPCAAAMLACALAAGAARGGPIITLGPSDGMALDQPYVQIEVFDPSRGGVSMGPTDSSYPFLLDTGAQGIVAVSSAVDELAAGGYLTSATFDEMGIGGLTSPYNVSLPYNLNVYGTSTQISMSPVRLLSNADISFDMGLGFGPFGIVGTPAMVNRVTTLNHAAMLENLTMDVSFSPSLPASAGHRYSVPLSLMNFPPTGRRDPNDPLPTYGPLLSAQAEVRFGSHAEASGFMIDSGAAVSMLSSATAFRLGLDTNGDGNFFDEAVDTVDFQGAAGIVTAPVLVIDSLRLKTKEKVDLVWTDCQVAIIDIDPNIAGVIGWDLMTSGYLGEFFGEGVGYVRQAQLDLRKASTGAGTLYLDIDPSLDSMSPGPMRWNAVSGNWGDGNRWTSAEPNAGLLAYISNGGTATLSQGSHACLALTLGFSAGESGSLNMTGGGLACGQVFIGYQGAGAVTQSGGEHRIDGDLYLGHFAGAFGSYQLSDGNLVVGGNEYVGYDGDGAFVQSGGRHIVTGRLNIGYYSDSNGAYTLSGGQLIVPMITVGPKASLTLAGGSLRADVADANRRTDIASEGFFHVTAGVHAVGEVVSPDASLLAGAVTVEAGASLTARRIAQQQATIAGTLRLQGPARTTSVLNSLNIAGATNAWTGTLDIQSNALVVACASGVEANAAYARLVNQARYASNNMVWDRAGLTSTSAQADTRHVTAVAVVLNRDDSSPGSPAFLSAFNQTADANLAVAVDRNASLVKYTYNGDADLNGIVDERDLDRFSTGYSDQRSATPKGLTGWAWGDFDNNGTIDERDLDLFSTAYSLHGAPLSSSAVPEPGTLVLLGAVGSIAAFQRRRRQ